MALWIILLGAGSLYIGYIVYLYFFKKLDLSIYKNTKTDNWAVVTGATDGIGLGYCQVQI